MAKEPGNPPLIGLRERRKFRNWTEAEMGQVIGATQSQYHKFESGAVRLDVYRALGLAHKLDCSIEELL
jgi:transcriptional regulator with XRE-family HTH domain